MTWEEELKKNIQTVEDLLPYVDLPPDEQEEMRGVLEKYPLSITPYYLSLIDFSDKNDPIYKMAVPSLAEAGRGGACDTSGEASNTVIPGLQHKYRETAMVLSTNQCAMYCRHCFRKRMVGTSYAEVARHFEEMREYILKHKEITNVLVSGGDSLVNSNERLELVLSSLDDIGHLDAIRLGTRTPVVFPSRILRDGALQKILREHNKRKQIYLVTQFNHYKEITEQSAAAVRCVQDMGIPVENQMVLLRGVNDDEEVMGKTLRMLTEIGVIPYYMFQCRPVKGVKNQFQVPLLEGYDIVEKAKAMQNGLGKSFRYCLSHTTGKLEILGPQSNGEMLFKYHEAGDPGMLGKIFAKRLDQGQAWLEEDMPVKE